MRYVVVHLLVLFRLLEAVGATVGSVEASQVKVATSLAGSLAIAFDLSSLAFIAVSRQRMEGKNVSNSERKKGKEKKKKKKKKKG